MKKMFAIILLFLCDKELYAQGQLIKINLGKDKDLLQKYTYAYPSFLKGFVNLKGSRSEPSLLNYNRLNDEMLFIGNKNDTLALSAPETVNNIVIGNDVYIYLGGSFVRQLTAYPSVNLELKSRLKYVGVEKKADGYGSYSNASSSESYTNVKNGTPVRIDADANLNYNLSDTYHLYNGKKLQPANKKIFIKLFAKHEKEIGDYIGVQRINFEKRADLEKLLQYAVSLN